MIDLKNCKCLNLSFNNLVSINGLKDFLFIEELILDNNNLENLRYLPVMSNLRILSINNNKVTKILLFYFLNKSKKKNGIFYVYTKKYFKCKYTKAKKYIKFICRALYIRYFSFVRSKNFYYP